jgi:nitroreductase
MTEKEYQAIITRHSTRRYAERPLEDEPLARVRDLLAEVQPLVPANRCVMQLHHRGPEEDLSQAIGQFGRIVVAPHYLVPYGLDDRHLWADLGYRVEQVAVGLTARGVASCYLGCLGRQAEVRAYFALPEGARVAALLAFGYPSEALTGRTINTVMRRVVGAQNKRPVEEIFFRETFQHPAAPPPALARIVEAARRAPSAVNAQPWRLLWREGTLYLFVQRSPKYGDGAGQDYRLHDGGVCMANVSLALRALDRAGAWRLLDAPPPGLTDVPADLEPLAALEASDSPVEDA